MPDVWLEEHIGPEAHMRDGFEDQLANKLSASWEGREVTSLALTRPPDQTRVRRRWMVGCVAAMIVALVGTFAVLDSDGDGRVRPSNDSATPTSVVLPAPTSVPGPEPTASPETVESVVEPTAVPSTTHETVTVPSTSPSVEPSVDLVVPLVGGDAISPTVLATVGVGNGDGQMLLPMDEFPISVAVFPHSIVIIEDSPSGYTGRALQFDRSGIWQQDLTVDGIEGTTPMWTSGSADGTLFIAAVVDEPEVGVRVTAHRLGGEVWAVVASADLPDLDVTDFDVTSDGVIAGGGQSILAYETGLTAPSIQVDVGAAGASTGVATIVRPDAQTGSDQTWTIEMELEAATPPLALSTRAAALGRGAWYWGTASSGPSTSTDFLALLDIDGDSRWYRFGPWTLAAADDGQLILTRVTSDGLVVAAFGSQAEEVPSAAAVTRPVIDLDSCPWIGASEGAYGPSEITLFARPSSLPIVRQVFGDPSGSIARPYALVQRYFANVRASDSTSPSGPDVNGHPAYVTSGGGRGAGTLWVLLDDGSELYIRSKGLDPDMLVQLARALVPRPPDSAIAGFDPIDALPLGLLLLDETASPIVIDFGPVSTCEPFPGGQLRAGVMSGDIVSRFGIALDAGTLPLVRDVDADTHLFVWGPRPDLLPPAFASLRQATTEEWATLLTGPTSQDYGFINAGLPDADLTAAFQGRSFASRTELEEALFPDLLNSVAAPLASPNAVYAAGGSFAIVTAELVPADPDVAYMWMIRLNPDAGAPVVESITPGARCGGNAGPLPPNFDFCHRIDDANDGG